MIPSYVSVTLVYAAFGDFKELCYDADGSIFRKEAMFIFQHVVMAEGGCFRLVGTYRDCMHAP